MTISLNCDVIETPYIHMNKDVNSANLSLVTKWIDKLRDDGYSFADSDKENLALSHPQILNVPKHYVIELLNSYKSHYLNMEFRTSNLVHLLEGYTDGTVDTWDILISNGRSEPTSFCGIDIKPIRRIFAIKENSKALQMSGKGARLGNASLAKGGLTKEKMCEIEEAAKRLRPKTEQGKSFSQEEYFNSGIERKPLLMIHPVCLDPKDDEEKIALIKEQPNLLVGLSIGIPSINGRKKESYRYRINLIKWRELLEIDDDYFEETGNEEES